MCSIATIIFFYTVEHGELHALASSGERHAKLPPHNERPSSSAPSLKRCIVSTTRRDGKCGAVRHHRTPSTSSWRRVALTASVTSAEASRATSNDCRIVAGSVYLHACARNVVSVAHLRACARHRVKSSFVQLTNNSKLGGDKPV
jgi:hypothetical protein